MKVGILDYKACNLASVFSSLYKLGIDPIIVNNSKELTEIDKLIIPGVGAAKNCMDYLKYNSFIDPLKDFLINKPILGICLGMQIFAKKLYENGFSEGIGYIDGEVKKLDTKIKFNIGWKEVKFKKKIKEKLNIEDLSSFYYCHSYYMSLKKNENCLATSIIDNNHEIPAIVLKNNFIGTQFHPEKSQNNGNKFLEFFLNWKKN
jgi:glutamine amidotransferase